MASSSSIPSVNQAAPTIQEYVVRVPKNQNKKFRIMRFNGSIGVDFTKWTNVKMERENNMVQFKNMHEEMPKFGAGSEYGREQREEARKKKYGMISKKYKPEDQPWILQHGGKTGKKFRGVREGGVGENASYYIFTQAADGAFEAFPVEEWYNFQTVQRYKALSIEEAEEEFSSRNRTLNLFNVMVRKRMTKKEEDGEEDGEEEGDNKGKGKKKKKSSKGDLRISETDDWMESSSGESSNDDDNEDDEDKKEKKNKNKKGKKGAKAKKKRKAGSDDEPLEDSDDGDGEGREVDYISSSSDESDTAMEAGKELIGVAEENALRRLLNSDEEDDEDEEVEFKEKEEENEDEADQEDDAGPSKEVKDDKKKKKDKDKKKKDKKDKKPRKEDYGSSSESDSDSSISEMEKAKPSPKIKSASAENSRSGTPTKPVASASSSSSTNEPTSDGKRKGGQDSSSAIQQIKKPRLDIAAAAAASSSSFNSADKDGVNEESVRRYLSRKPMTTTELLQKFKSKRTGLSSDQLVHVIAQILKKINPVKQTIKGKMYLSIKG